MRDTVELKEALEKAFEEKGCRLVVKITPLWSNFPETYYNSIMDYQKDWLMEFFVKEFIDIIADKIPAVIISENKLKPELEEYAKRRSLIVIEQQDVKNATIIDIMGSYKRYTSGEKKWKYTTRKVLNRIIAVK